MPDHLIVLHRWTDEYADYGSYIDHRVHRVTYVATPRSTASLPEQAAAVKTVSSTEDGKQVRAAVRTLVEEFGHPSRIIALHEVDLDMAAELREELGVPGEQLAALAPFRDKLAMARKLAAAGVPLPATEPAPDHAALRKFGAAHGWPILVKPVRGTASAGVVRLDSAADVAGYTFPSDEAMLVQPYLPHDIVHVDGVATADGLGAWRASRYLNTCLAFTEGSSLGSVELDDPQLLAHIEAFTQRVTRAMSAEPWVFHLELFLSGSSEAPQLHVLEVGARPGGAEIPFLWREVHGVDLMHVAFALQAGAPVPDFAQRAVSDQPGECAGWLLVPTPAARPCRVTAAEKQWDAEQGPYAERIPAKGQTLSAVPGYEHSGARFRFRAASSAEVQRAVERTVLGFDYRCTPLDDTAPDLLVVIGSGGHAYREYAFASASRRTDLALVTPTAPSWQEPYVSAHRHVTDTAPDTLVRAVSDLALTTRGRVGILTWDEALLEATAEAAHGLGLNHMSPAAVRNCRDKLATRQLLRAAGLPAVRFAHVHGLGEALKAADSIGYPVVVKPRSLAGSVGVVIAHNAEELRTQFRVSAEASFPGIDSLDGLVLEEFLDGPEISVDSVVRGSDVQVLNVAHKRLGFAPYFEEVGHLVAPWRHEPWADDLTHLVHEAHRLLGISTGVTHAEVRLTAAGPAWWNSTAASAVTSSLFSADWPQESTSPRQPQLSHLATNPTFGSSVTSVPRSGSSTRPRTPWSVRSMSAPRQPYPASPR
ncbi:ATP-grasp domain-containing protein [Streptomyces sp. G5(2025)]|uniref:ATP-grasp domain-containing protein n=1 Tax=Streptomyces sp. G5(2025) TaxID=3406628 RepID=UPI003C169C23